MSKIIWIECKQTVQYNQQHTVTDEEYELLKQCELWDIDQCDHEVSEIYDILENYINPDDVFDIETEYQSVQIKLDNK